MRTQEHMEKVMEIRTDTSVIRKDRDNIIHVLFIRNSKITPETLKEDHRAFKVMVNKNLYAFLFEAEENVNYTSEAREFASRLNSDNMAAVAVVVKNLAYRFTAEIYYKTHKPQVPYKVFGSTEEAEHWLKLYS